MIHFECRWPVLLVLLVGVALGLLGWIFWFLAYREAAKQAREADELLLSMAIKIQQKDVQGCVPIAIRILKRAHIYVAERA